MKLKLVVAVVCILLLPVLPGCSATLKGLQADFQQNMRGGGDFFSSSRQVSPEQACEPVYRREGAGSGYHRCLRRQIRANLSEEDLHELRYAKAFPGCTKTYRNPQASLPQYESCQVDAYVSAQEERIVRQREATSRRNGGRSTARHSSRNVGR